MGDYYALRTLANMHREGIGIDENKSEALVLYRRALLNGDNHANLYLAEMYKNGEGTEIDVRKAIRHFEQYAKCDKGSGHWNLALIYENQGHQNENLALYHLRLAADLGHEEARKKLEAPLYPYCALQERVLKCFCTKWKLKFLSQPVF